MSLKNYFTENSISADNTVTFTYEQGADVFHFNETHIETALSETDVVERMAEVATSGLTANTPYGGAVLETLRDANLLEGYERGSESFQEYVADAIRENFYDAEVIEESTQHYDHKRGFTTLSATVTAPAGDITKNLSAYASAFSGWTAQVNAKGGTFTFDV
tara:strand:- start:2395 stop:2880 length:486 start_codon:yes stop_codon:yes gene_type:complete